MADESSWREWFSELEMDYHINYWHNNGGNTLEHPQGLIINNNAPTTMEKSSSIISEQTNLQQVVMSSGNNNNNNTSKHTLLYPKSYVVSNNYNPCFASYELSNNTGSDYDHNGTCYSSLPLSTSSSSSISANNKKRKSEPIDHIISERRRRQELTKKFIALSATIPGLKKMDRVYVLSEAYKYVKQLQERVKELEQAGMNEESSSSKCNHHHHLYIEEKDQEEYTTNASLLFETNIKNNNGRVPLFLPDVKASVLGKDILIKIHCGKQNGIVPQILSQIQSHHHHLSLVSTNVLPFGDTLDITIIAKMGDNSSSIIVKDLVKNLRMALLKSFGDDVQQFQ